MAYLKDPQQIYQASFAAIREEADLGCLPETLRTIALRMIHACGMTDIVSDIRFDPAVAKAAGGALLSSAPILADCEAVRAAIISRFLPEGTEILCTLNDPKTPELAHERGTTRSAAAVSLWEEHLAGAVVVIGNAPTALFALLEALDAGAPKPAAILAMPVGFVGAAESKLSLRKNPRGVPFLTLLGRRGGSAIAAAALNAIALEHAQ